MGKEGRSEYVCSGVAREEACDECAASPPLRQEARDLNVLARFLGQRDLPLLSRDAVARVASTQVDVAVLFGGSILAGGEVLADAMKAGIARTYVIVGGAGYTTETLRERARAIWPRIDVAPGAAEAEIFDAQFPEKEKMRLPGQLA